MSSSQLTFTPSFFRGVVGIPPTRIEYDRMVPAIVEMTLKFIQLSIAMEKKGRHLSYASTRLHVATSQNVHLVARCSPQEIFRLRLGNPKFASMDTYPLVNIQKTSKNYGKYVDQRGNMFQWLKLRTSFSLFQDDFTNIEAPSFHPSS